MFTEITPDVVMAEVERAMSPRWDPARDWGKLDCCATASAVFEVLHGVDLFAAVRGQYWDARSALTLLRARGGFLPFVSRLADEAGLVLGNCMPGNIGVTEPLGRLSGVRRSLAVCVQAGVWAAKSPDGIAFLPRVEMEWSCVRF